jgi:hypothetical protein
VILIPVFPRLSRARRKLATGQETRVTTSQLIKHDVAVSPGSVHVYLRRSGRCNSRHGGSDRCPSPAYSA